jgi:hypothetical protein
MSSLSNLDPSAHPDPSANLDPLIAVALVLRSVSHCVHPLISHRHVPPVLSAELADLYDHIMVTLRRAASAHAHRQGQFRRKQRRLALVQRREGGQ